MTVEEHTSMASQGRWIGWLVMLAIFIVVHPIAASETAEEEPDPWAALRLLVGSWEGAIDGKLGTGRGQRRYEFIIGGKYLMERHSSVRLPQEKSPKGDQHEQLGVFSFDQERGKIVFREFMIEGVVPRSVCETQDMEVVCVSEAVESGPGIRARLTLRITDRYRFEERYELAFPGKELELYFVNQWTRVPVADAWK